MKKTKKTNRFENAAFVLAFLGAGLFVFSELGIFKPTTWDFLDGINAFNSSDSDKTTLKLKKLANNLVKIEERTDAQLTNLDKVRVDIEKTAKDLQKEKEELVKLRADLIDLSGEYQEFLKNKVSPIADKLVSMGANPLKSSLTEQGFLDFTFSSRRFNNKNYTRIFNPNFFRDKDFYMSSTGIREAKGLLKVLENNKLTQIYVTASYDEDRRLSALSKERYKVLERFLRSQSPKNIEITSLVLFEPSMGRDNVEIWVKAPNFRRLKKVGAR